MVKDSLPALKYDQGAAYDQQIARVFGTRIQEYFATTTLSALLGAASDELDESEPLLLTDGAATAAVAEPEP